MSISLGYVGLFSSGMTVEQGYIARAALAIVAFVCWYLCFLVSDMRAKELSNTEGISGTI